jgi:N-acetylneuraminate epimerase
VTRLAAALATAALVAPPRVGAQWAKLPPLPDPEGFAGPFAGVSGGALVVAGGANFPGKRPWEGGKKAWSDTVFVLDKPDGAWRVVGKLPRPLGYGVSVTHRGSVVCAGGGDVDRHYPDVFRLGWAGRGPVLTPLPPLPRPVANACGALVGEDTLVVVGGQDRPDAAPALRTVYSLDLAAEASRWRELPPLPGDGLILACAAAIDCDLYVAGGASLVAGPDGVPKRTYRKEVYRLRPGRDWERVADLPRPAVAAPSPAPADAGGFYVCGGDDGSAVGFSPPERHPGFARSVLRFDAAGGQWAVAAEWPTPRVVTPAVRWQGRWVVPSGEARPGVRSPDVWAFTPKR